MFIKEKKKRKRNCSWSSALNKSKVQEKQLSCIDGPSLHLNTSKYTNSSKKKTNLRPCFSRRRKSKILFKKNLPSSNILTSGGRIGKSPLIVCRNSATNSRKNLNFCLDEIISKSRNQRIKRSGKSTLIVRDQSCLGINETKDSHFNLSHFLIKNRKTGAIKKNIKYFCGSNTEKSITKTNHSSDLEKATSRQIQQKKVCKSQKSVAGFLIKNFNKKVTIVSTKERIKLSNNFTCQSNSINSNNSIKPYKIENLIDNFEIKSIPKIKPNLFNLKKETLSMKRAEAKNVSEEFEKMDKELSIITKIIEEVDNVGGLAFKLSGVSKYQSGTKNVNFHLMQSIEKDDNLIQTILSKKESFGGKRDPVSEENIAINESAVSLESINSCALQLSLLNEGSKSNLERDQEKNKNHKNYFKIKSGFSFPKKSQNSDQIQNPTIPQNNISKTTTPPNEQQTLPTAILNCDFNSIKKIISNSKLLFK